jgi:hypothetical protein
MKGAAGLPMISAYEWFSMAITTVCTDSGTGGGSVLVALGEARPDEG